METIMKFSAFKYFFSMFLATVYARNTSFCTGNERNVATASYPWPDESKTESLRQAADGVRRESWNEGIPLSQP